MALDANRLADAIKTELEGLDPAGFGALPPADRTGIKGRLFQAIANALVAELTTNGEVAFGAGTITGADAPGGDTHDGLVASGGTIT